MRKTASNDCFAASAELMRHADAVEQLKLAIMPTAKTEAVPLAAAGSRVLAEAVCSPYPVPRHTNAAVDGYAFSSTDYDADAGTTLPTAGRASAGHPLAPGTRLSGAAVRILTGAVMPDELDSIAMQEDTESLQDGERAMVRLPRGLKAGANVRKAGEDLQQGQEIFAPGHILRPQDLAALASIGHGTVKCFRRLRVGIVSSGDEIVRAGARELDIGEVYDANAPMLGALVGLTGAEVIDLGVWPDELDQVTRRLAEAARDLDVILTSGGASQGEEDYMSAALASLGSRHFWRIAVKPGRPMMFGQIDQAMMIGLPGNPVAVFVCFLMYVYPLLRCLAGAAWPTPRPIMMPAAFGFPNRKLGRREFWRASLIDGPDGARVEKFARDGSGLISGLRAADGLIEIDENVPAIRRGDPVAFIPFSEFGILSR